MRRFSYFALSFVFVCIAAVSAFAQTGGAQPAPTKIGWIDTGEFSDEKTGITKFVNAYKALADQVKPRQTEMVTMQNKLKAIADELARDSKNPAIAQSALIAKQDEGEKLQRELKYKKEDYDAFVQKKSAELLGPVQVDISKAIREFAKQKGYTAILDIDKLGQAGAILALDATVNVTKDFIAFYNARPAGAATAAIPK